MEVAAEKTLAEKARPESYEMLSTIMDSLDAVVYVVDMKTYEILFVNKYTQDIFGDVLGKICWETFQSGQLGPCDFCTNDKLLDAEGEPVGVYEWEYYNEKVGRWYSIRDHAIRWGDGRIVRLEIAIDVTRQKEKEKELRKKERQLLESQKVARLGSWEWDVQTGDIHWSDENYVLFGVDPCEFVPSYKAFLNMVHPDDRQMLDSKVRESLEKKIPYHVDVRIINPDGTKWVMEARATVECDNTGNPIMLAGTSQDITERKLSEEAKRISEEKFKIIFDNAFDGILLADSETKNFLMGNKMICQMLGYAEGELMNLSVMDIHPENDLPYVIEQFEKQARGEIRLANDLPVKRKDGSVFYADVSTSRIIIENQIYLIGIFRDVTKRKQRENEIHKLNEELEERVRERTAEIEDGRQALVSLVEDLGVMTDDLTNANKRLQELDTMKSMFIASTSHELRTPLNSIIGFASILLEGWSGELNPEQKEQIELIHTSGKHLLNLINDVIDISKVEAGKIDLYPKEFDLKDVVGESISSIQIDANNKGLAITVDVPDIAITTDRKRLLQCLLNILSNAVKFTEKGSVTITAKTINNDICISVTDTGIGINSEDLTKLFAPFVRLESPLTQKTSGTGLGLYLTRKIATEVLGGSVEVESEDGKGSRFTLCVPIKLQEKEV